MYGLLNLSFWGYMVAGLILTQITIAAVTLFLHRCQSHRALILNPMVSHFFRFWLWLTTGMVTKEWVAIHRKHHANTDVEGDPHSPKLLGIRKLILEGAEVYREASKDKAMIEKYSHGTPNDWIERHLYSRYPVLGISVLLILDLLFFGIPGLTMWGLQMLWIPFHAAGLINGVGHYFGYRNFESPDVSRNMMPWGLWMGGEELHNNHHAYASSAKFSIKWWEFDMGWFYIQLLSFFKLATVKKLPPRLFMNTHKKHIDIDTVKAVVGNRLQVMADYYRRVIVPAVRLEKRGALRVENQNLLRSAARLLIRSDKRLTESAKQQLSLILARFEQLKKVYQYRTALQHIWMKTAASQKDIIEALQQWCKQAEASGIEALRQFSLQLKQYQLKM